MIRDVLAYLRAVGRAGKFLLTGGAMIAALFVAEAFQIHVPSWIKPAVVALTLIVAPFEAWREERKTRTEAETRLRRFEEKAVRQVGDDEFWLIAAATKYGLNLGSYPNRHGTGKVVLFSLDQKPIEAKWLPNLVGRAVERGLIRSEARIYFVTDVGTSALTHGRGNGRVPKPPGPLVDGLSGEVISLPLN